ncbi:MAG TPA: hypothetical protein VIM57_04870 [Luteolibacter sp.]
MKRLLAAALLLGVPTLHAKQDPFGATDEVPAAEGNPHADPAGDAGDLLRFLNADQLNGRFGGIKPGPLVLWRRDDISAPVEFRTDRIRQIALRKGRAAKALPTSSSIDLVNGDRIPGTLTALDDHRITIDTPFAGPVTLPRDRVAMIAPNPTGGRVLYTGPFSPEGWTVIGSGETGVSQEQENAPEPRKPAREVPGWSHAGGAWYNRFPASVLKRDVELPDRSIVRFQLAWKNRIALALAFHADFKDLTKPGEAPEDSKRVDVSTQSYPKHFGRAYVLNLYQNYVVLYRSGYDPDGKPIVERLQSGGTNIRLPETGEARVELRCNRTTGEISLYLNDEFATQWTEAGEGGYAAPGGGIGFISAGGPVRLSEMSVAQWNGMPDSARSLQTDEQDVILLANGTDRFAGEITGLRDGNLTVKARYGNFQFPLSEVAEIRIARNKLAKPGAQSQASTRIRFQPLGSIAGVVESGTADHLRFLSPLAGKLEIDLDYVVMLDFKNSNSIVDEWDPPF